MMRVAEKMEVKFTRSSVIVYKAMADFLNLKDGDVLFCSVLHDVNGSGNLYGANKTDLRGSFGNPVLIHRGNAKRAFAKWSKVSSNAIMVADYLMICTEPVSGVKTNL